LRKKALQVNAFTIDRLLIAAYWEYT
jgi:hypothetical protein